MDIMFSIIVMHLYYIVNKSFFDLGSAKRNEGNQ